MEPDRALGGWPFFHPSCMTSPRSGVVRGACGLGVVAAGVVRGAGDGRAVVQLQHGLGHLVHGLAGGAQPRIGHAVLVHASGGRASQDVALLRLPEGLDDDQDVVAGLGVHHGLLVHARVEVLRTRVGVDGLLVHHGHLLQHVVGLEHHASGEHDLLGLVDVDPLRLELAGAVVGLCRQELLVVRRGLRGVAAVGHVAGGLRVDLQLCGLGGGGRRNLGVERCGTGCASQRKGNQGCQGELQFHGSSSSK